MTRDEATIELMFGLLLIAGAEVDLSPSDVIDAMDKALDGDRHCLALVRLLAGNVAESERNKQFIKQRPGRPKQTARDKAIAAKADNLIQTGKAANDTEASRLLDGDIQGLQVEAIRKQIRNGRRSLAKLHAQRFGGLIISLIESHDQLASLEGRRPLGEIILEFPA